MNIEIQVAEYWNTGNVTASLGRRESLSLIFIPDLPGASLKENNEESSLLKVHKSQQRHTCIISPYLTYPVSLMPLSVAV